MLLITLHLHGRLSTALPMSRPADRETIASMAPP